MSPTLLKVAIAATLLVPATYAHAQQTSVPIAFHRQEHSLSCEIASLKTALKVFGIEVSETDLINQLSFDPTPKGNGIWGDPNKGFVGNINGRMLVTGYGVYAKPIAAVGKHYIHAQVITDSSPPTLARAIAAGHPVIMWGYYGSGAVHRWHTPSGTAIKALDGEHTRVVYGFDGGVDSPNRFYLMDPLTGSFSWSTAELTKNWDGLDRMGVIVSPRWVRAPGETKVWELSADGKTRSHITSWSVFTSRGGTAAAIVTLAKDKLGKYIVGPEIR